MKIARRQSKPSKAKIVADYIIKAYGDQPKFDTVMAFDLPVRKYLLESIREKLSVYRISVDYNQVLEKRGHRASLKQDRFHLLFGRDT